MEFKFMSSKTMLVCIFCSLMLNTVSAKEFDIKTVGIKFPKMISEENIEKSLTQMGIFFNEYSTINIHKEENFIDLICFNCIVRSVDSNEYISGSINELTR